MGGNGWVPGGALAPKRSEERVIEVHIKWPLTVLECSSFKCFNVIEVTVWEDTMCN